MTDAEVIAILFDMLDEASNHLDYCCYGDKWERECAQASKLEERIGDALRIGKEHMTGWAPK